VIFCRAATIAALLIGLAAPSSDSFAQYYPPYSYPPPQAPSDRPVPLVDPDDDNAPTTQSGATGSTRADPRGFGALPPEVRPETGPKKALPPQFRRALVDYDTREPAGTIIVDTPSTYLYLVLGRGKALRYGIGVGREGFTWTGAERVSRMAQWPDWNPPEQMIARQPYLPRFMAGGEGNPLGARALYLGNTLYRIHGTNQPSTIGSFVSSGCIRLTNEDVIDLYTRVKVGTRVVVLPAKPQVRQVGVTEGASHRSRREPGGSKDDRVKRPNEREAPKSVAQGEADAARNNAAHSTAFEE
jgi:lipoprotein-anchoring transpeptidase ErfK/SrfK